MQRVRAPEGVPVIPNLVRLISFFFLSSPGRNVEKKEKRKDQRKPGRVTDANAFETESPGKTRVRAAGAQSCILLGWSNARRFSRRSFIGCHIVSGFICIVKRPRRADIATTHSPTNTQQEERILFLTRARAVLARACSKGCSRRVEFSLSSPPLSLRFTKEDFYAGGSLCTVLYPRAAIDRSRRTRGSGRHVTLLTFRGSYSRCTPPSESKLLTFLGLGLDGGGPLPD